MKLLACNSNLVLSEEIAAILNIPLTKASIKKFSDEEIFVEVNENVRGQDVYVIQSTSKPANDNLVEIDGADIASGEYASRPACSLIEISASPTSYVLFTKL